MSTEPIRGPGRPRGGYFDSAGNRVISTTECLGEHVRKDKHERLVAWSNRLTGKGEDHEGVRDEAADIGTTVHDAIEAHVFGEDVEAVLNRNPCEETLNAWKAWLEWEERTKPRWVLLEVPLVSEQFGFGGTVDAVAHIDCPDGEVTAVMDWKSSRSWYLEHLIQLGAYRILLRECRGLDIDQGRVVVVPKTGEGPKEKRVGRDVLDCAERVFRRRLGLLREERRLGGAL